MTADVETGMPQADAPVAPDAAHEPIQTVGIGIVALNEESALPGLLADVLAQDFPLGRIELLLADSGSTDGTRAVMERFAAEHGARFARVAVLDNPGRIAAAGINVCLDACRADAFVRIDAHATIPADFISACVAVLEEGEYVAAGPRPTMAFPETPWTNTLLVAEESAFGSSVADYRFRAESTYVDSAFHAMMRRCVIDAVGRYDERLPRTEDNDYFYRIRLAGFRIRFDGRIFSRQHARASLRRMAKQKYGNGYWVGRTLFIQPKCLKAYHFAPFVFVLGILALIGTGCAASWVPFLACGAAYLLICIALAVRAAAQSTKRCAAFAALPLVFFTIHATYGVGTCAGIVRGLFDKLRGR